MIDLSSKICQKQRHEDRHHTVLWQAGHSATQAWKALNKALQAAPVCGPSRTICAGDPRSCPLYAFRAWSPWAALWCRSARPFPKRWSHCWHPPKAPGTWSCSRLMEVGGGVGGATRKPDPQRTRQREPVVWDYFDVAPGWSPLSGVSSVFDLLFSVGYSESAHSFSHRPQGGRPGFARLEANLAVGIPKIPGKFLERALIQAGKKRRSPCLVHFKPESTTPSGPFEVGLGGGAGSPNHPHPDNRLTPIATKQCN